MPIRPENRGRYPLNWPEIRARIQRRAGDKCERCAVPNKSWRIAGEDQWTKDPMQVETWTCVDGLKVSQIVCTTAHIDHTPEHCEDDNLLFLCQRCHLRHDAEHHAQTAYAARRAAKAVGDLFA